MVIVRTRARSGLPFALAVALAAVAPRAEAEPGGQCRVLELGFQPASDGPPFAPQIVGWVEDAAGTYVDTVYITRETGTFGLGNRPGRFDFNSAPLWPYGRRITVFPVWAHRHGLSFHEVVFQDGVDSFLSHAQADSSIERHYCRPLKPEEADALSCPSTAFTDKGVLSTEETSGYPPRDDLDPLPQDSPSVEMYAALNPFDAVSQPTPIAGAPAAVTWAIPPALPAGDYVLWLEVSKEFDMNASYNPDRYPAPVIPYGSYGAPYRGQPSVLYRVPFAITDGEATASTDRYAGYGDPDGLDGDVRSPDTTISDTPGSGAGRLALIADGGAPYRVRVTTRVEQDVDPPVAPQQATVTDLTAHTATIEFAAPGDDGQAGEVAGYEIRYRVRAPITDADFATATLVPSTPDPGAPGVPQRFDLEGLLPETTYYVAIRAYDNCRNASPLTVLEVTTPERPLGEVDACFVATAAYGSVMAADVELLRRFRDALLSRTALGELAIETYYTFGPALAGVIGESDVLRATSRDALAPLVTRVKNLRW